MKRAPQFKTEADLCSAFLAWVARRHPAVRAYAEWAGWDILLVYPEGWQLGIQAKLRLNAEVIGQAAPNAYGFDDDHDGPDYRAVLVPGVNPLSGLAARVGLVVFRPGYGDVFLPDLTPPSWPHQGERWLDWNPATRHDLPPSPTDSIAGSPCPVTLSTWKLGALAVLAELKVRGTITTKRMRALGVNPSRWLSGCWLEPAATRGLWVRGDRCPKFDEQHPTAFALALEKARAAQEVSA